MSNGSSSGSSIGILGLLGVAFIVLKLTHYIDWSWWWVTLPFWGGFAVVIVVLLIWLFFLLAGDFSEKSKSRSKKP